MKPKTKHTMSTSYQIKAAFPFRSSVYEFMFHLGYQGLEFPRWIRKLLAKTKIHKAWFSGFTGLGILSIMEITNSTEDVY